MCFWLFCSSNNFNCVLDCFRLKPDQLEFLLEVEQLRILFWEECELSNSQREHHYNQCTVSVRTEKKHSWFLKSFIFYQFCWQDKLSQATLIFSFTKHCLSGIILSECGSDVMGMPNSWCWLGHPCWQPINWPIYVTSFSNISSMSSVFASLGMKLAQMEVARSEWWCTGIWQQCTQMRTGL